MSLSQPVPGLEQRTCSTCGALQESPGSTVCEQCGADLPRLTVVRSVSTAPRWRAMRILGVVVWLLIAGPVRVVRRGIAALVLLVFLVVRSLALLLLLASLTVGLSFVPQVRARVPLMNGVAATAQTWLHRAGEMGGRWVGDLKPHPTAPPVATSQKPATARPPATQSITVKSTPSGATVQLDTRQIGKTPLTLKIATGLHKVVVSRPGYASVTRTITVKSGQGASLNITLTATP